jgi:hypothetical protein
MSDASEATGTLPFVRNNPSGEGHQFWHVKPSGEHQVDYALGHGFAFLALEMAAAVHNPALVGWIIAEMGRNPAWRSIEVGFIRGVTDLACVTLAMGKGNPSCACASTAARS